MLTIFNFDVLRHLQDFVLSLFNLTHLTLDIARQVDIACFDYFKVTIFWKRQFVKNRSFTKFWFVGSKNWFVIHESWTLIPTLLFNSEIAKMEFSIFWIWADLRRFSWRFTFFEEIWGDLRRYFKFEEIWGDLRRRSNPECSRNLEFEKRTDQNFITQNLRRGKKYCISKKKKLLKQRLKEVLFWLLLGSGPFFLDVVGSSGYILAGGGWW